MSRTRGAGLVLLALGAGCVLSGAERLELAFERAGRELASVAPFAGASLLVGLVLLVIGGLLVARSFLDAG